MYRKGDTSRMDPFYILLFLGFGLIFGITGTAIVYTTQYIPVDRRVAGLGVFFLGCAVSVYYNLQMPPTPFVPIPLLTTITGFLIHPLFFAAGALVISGFSRYLLCLRKDTVFSALFFTAGITAVLGGTGFYVALPSVTGMSDFAIFSNALLRGIVDASLAVVFFTGACEGQIFLQKRQAPPLPEQ
ncbi:hypothetical protein L0665_05840 [Methanogenium marinum]|uniref:Uncharacterized protein n=1 Tax=Methanogenium marinum TaxID=348610 RepID=A0A9Q4KT55_9EURY|nr:hypothetical protein [Methanogenium marinum]MDE4908129.1 hypothetical protein [Methanogenium marinum]